MLMLRYGNIVENNIKMRYGPSLDHFNILKCFLLILNHLFSASWSLLFSHSSCSQDISKLTAHDYNQNPVTETRNDLAGKVILHTDTHLEAH